MLLPEGVLRLLVWVLLCRKRALGSRPWLEQLCQQTRLGLRGASGLLDQQLQQ